MSISGVDCPLTEFIIDKGPGWPDFDSQPVKVVSIFMLCTVYFNMERVPNGKKQTKQNASFKALFVNC